VIQESVSLTYEPASVPQVLQFQGDQREAVRSFLVANEIATKDDVKVHGF